MPDLTTTITWAVREVFGPDTTIASIEPIDGGRGVFSRVMRCCIAGRSEPVAVKVLRDDANGAAAMSGGGATREALAYRRVLPRSPEVSAPHCHGVVADAEGRPVLVLEDLSDQRWSDQLDGLSDHDVRLIVAELIALHEQWSDEPGLLDLDVRRDTPATLSAEGLDRGVAALASWPLGPTAAKALEGLAARRAGAVEAFLDEGDPTLCHGDPRADNVAFRGDRAVLFDWQQMAIQFGESDLAWLLATSCTPERRRAIESDLVASYALSRGQDAATTWRRYCVGMVLPGLAVLFLAQRESNNDRTRRFIATSLERIGTAVDDLVVVSS